MKGLYAIADSGVLAARGVDLRKFAEGLRAAGVRTVQWRCKEGSQAEVLAGAALLREVFAGSGCLLVMNDRVDLALLAGFDGVHVGQGDMRVEDVRAVVKAHSSQRRDEWSTEGAEFVVGVSTHTESEVRAAEETSADYVAVGPVFGTGTKLDAAPVVGLEGVRRSRTLTTKPLVAIGGITLENCLGVVEAGADAVAVISGLMVPGLTVESVARKFGAGCR